MGKGKKKGKPNTKGGSPGTVYKPSEWEKEIIGKPTDKLPQARVNSVNDHTA